MVFYPARYGTGRYGSSRYSQLQRISLPGARTIVRRIASFGVGRDAVTGHRVPTFTEDDITATLVEQFGDMPAFAAGVVMTQDAVIFTQDPLVMLDQIKDSEKIFEVAEIEEKSDSAGGFVYRVAHLHRLELYREN